MGCDIHAWAEVKIAGTWHTLTEVPINRDYALFSRMAGVRRFVDDPPAIAPDRGIPTDASVIYKWHCQQWRGDAHSHSWMAQAEVAALEIELGDCRFGYLFGNGWADRLEDGIEDARLVFFFDN